MKSKGKNTGSDPRQLTLKLVRLEPDLEATAGDYDANQCDAAARRFYRYAKQLWVKASVLRRLEHAGQPCVEFPEDRRPELN